MPAPRTCRRCGKPLGAEGAAEVCPRCLLGLGLGLELAPAPGLRGALSSVLELSADDLPEALRKPRSPAGRPRGEQGADSPLFGSISGGTDTKPEEKGARTASAPPPAPRKSPQARPASKSKRRQAAPIKTAPIETSPYRRGDVIGRKYKVYDILGRGGFGIVYLVYSYETESVLALKTFRDDLMHDPGARARFMREAQVWVTLGNHPHTVRAYFATEIAGRLYIALEFIAKDERGLNTLGGHIERGKLPDLRCLGWAVQFCYGIEHAYARGCRCHRDIKPGNIMITQDGRAKVSDFGLVAFADTETELDPDSRVLQPQEGAPPPAVSEGAGGPAARRFAAPTMQGVGVGTPTHMPPEQFVNAAGCDERSDIYSFGVVLYEMASSGELPFAARAPKVRSPAALRRYWTDFYRLHRDAPVPKIDVPLWRIIRRCLEKNPERRFQRFEELRFELSEIIRGITGEAPPEPQVAGVEAWDWTNRGATLVSLGLTEGAAKCLEQAIRIDPEHAGAWNNKASVLMSKAAALQASRALRQAHDARVLSPSKGSRAAGPGTLPEIDSGAGAPGAEPLLREALECCERALGISPHNPAFWDNKGRALGKLGRMEEAVRCFERAVEINPRYATAWISRARLLEDSGRIVDALRCYERAAKVDPQHAPAWVGTGDILEQLGRPGEAIERYDRAIRCGPSYAVAWNNKGLSLFKQGNYQEAVDCCERATELDPDLARAWSNRGAGLVELGRPEEALVCLERSLELDGDSASALLNRGEALFQLGRYEEARESCDSAIGLDRHCADAWNNKGNCLQELGRYDEAMECYDRALRIDPDRAGAWANKAVCSERQGHLRAAARSYDRAIARERGSAIYCTRKGDILVEQGRLHDALVAFDKAVEIDERESSAWCRRGSVLRGLGRLDEALHSFNQAIKLDPEDPVFWTGRGNVEAASGRLEDAVRCYNRALRIDPAYAAAWMNKGACLYRLGLRRRAIRSLDEGLRLDPANARALANKAACLVEMGAFDEAVICCDEALRLDPRFVTALVNKGNALVSRAAALRASRALRQAHDARVLSPSKGARAADFGGLVEMGGGGGTPGPLLKKAIECYTRALEIAPARADIWRSRAAAEEASGRTAEAVASLDEFLSRSTDLDAEERAGIEEHVARLRRPGREAEAKG